MHSPSKLDTVSNKVLLLFGPTASGKNDVLEKLFSEKSGLPPFALISADSVQVYRGLDIGSAKPDIKTQNSFPHELINLIDPDEAFSVADFYHQAGAACEKHRDAGRLPVISGGTAYYLKAFIYGLPEVPGASAGIRNEIQEELKAKGPEALRDELRRVDPASYERLSANDHYRLTRALEVYRTTGRPLSAFRLPQKPEKKWDILSIAINWPREELYKRINSRVDKMIDMGLEAEIQKLLAAGHTQDDPGLRAIGYREFLEGQMDGKWPEGKERSAIIGKIKQHTRNYAKRQLTFMRSLPDVHWFQADDLDGISATVKTWL